MSDVGYIYDLPAINLSTMYVKLNLKWFSEDIIIIFIYLQKNWVSPLVLCQSTLTYSFAYITVTQVIEVTKGKER